MTEPGRKLVEEGYAVLKGILPRDMVARLKTAATASLEAAGAAHRDQQKATGSLIHLAADATFAELIAFPPALEALAGLGAGSCAFSSGYVISKPPGGPPLFWHQDWWGWDAPESYTRRVLQIFAMYYLDDTSVENGCLRVIPGSHRKRHALHEQIGDAHGQAMALAEDLTQPAFLDHPDQVAVPVRAGDLVVGDARLIHGAFGNGSSRERTLLTLWYHPDFGAQPAGIRARVACLMRRVDVDTDPDGQAEPFPDCWPAAAAARVDPHLTHYRGQAAPLAWNRTPGAGLR